MCHVLAQCQEGLQDHATPWHSTASRTGERGMPAVDRGGQQQSWNGNSSSNLSNNYSVHHLHVCALVRLLSGQLRPHRLNRRGSLGACPGYFRLDCLACCWLLVTEGEKAEGFSPCYQVCCPSVYFQQDRKLQKHGGTLTSSHVSPRG